MSGRFTRVLRRGVWNQSQEKARRSGFVLLWDRLASRSMRRRYIVHQYLD
jgi:hypothetical protein